MTFKTFGNPEHPVLILIHGMLTPWQIFLPHIEYFSNRYYVILPVIDSHDPEHLASFTSIDDQTNQIRNYLENNHIVCVKAVCGLSLGGIIAWRLYEKNQDIIQTVVMDGAPLCSYPTLIAELMAKNYIKILDGSRKRCPKTLKNYERYFLPIQYLEDYLAIADTIDDASVKQIMRQTATGSISPRICIQRQESVLYIHGTAFNELLSKQTAKLVKRLFPHSKCHCFQGDKHCYQAIYQPNIWCEIVDNHIKN